MKIYVFIHFPATVCPGYIVTEKWVTPYIYIFMCISATQNESVVRSFSEQFFGRKLFNENRFKNSWTILYRSISAISSIKTKLHPQCIFFNIQSSCCLSSAPSSLWQFPRFNMVLLPGMFTIFQLCRNLLIQINLSKINGNFDI